MRALHIASFNGNIGDIANHQGFYSCFRRYVNQDCTFEQMEIRDFYYSWGLKKFDMDFVEVANQYDIVILGGGSFFEPRWDHSATGTTFDLSDNILSHIKTPMWFNSVGFSVYKGSSDIALDKFKRFINFMSAVPNKYLISVRNDGSYDLLQDYFESDIIKNIHKCPDFGYFVNPTKHNHAEIAEDKTNIAVVLGGDMPEIRFPYKSGYITREEFVRVFSNMCKTLLESHPNRRIVFIPHIPKDLNMITEIWDNMPDFMLRNQISCAPYLNGNITDGLVNIDLYRHCDLVLGMRHHSNICSIAVNVPNIAIINYGPHEKDYFEIGLQHRCFNVNRPGFEKQLMVAIQSALDNPEKFKEENELVLENMESLCRDYFMHVNNWLNAIY